MEGANKGGETGFAAAIVHTKTASSWLLTEQSKYAVITRETTVQRLSEHFCGRAGVGVGERLIGRLERDNV